MRAPVFVVIFVMLVYKWDARAKLAGHTGTKKMVASSASATRSGLASENQRAMGASPNDCMFQYLSIPFGELLSVLKRDGRSYTKTLHILSGARAGPCGRRPGGQGLPFLREPRMRPDNAREVSRERFAQRGKPAALVIIAEDSIVLSQL